ncbi:MAG: hypothetical protein PHE29_14220 [Tissierellia bacterium]|nr:hypothetical protein [Tissierellia bacterium]
MKQNNKDISNKTKYSIDLKEINKREKEVSKSESSAIKKHADITNKKVYSRDEAKNIMKQN